MYNEICARLSRNLSELRGERRYFPWLLADHPLRLGLCAANQIKPQIAIEIQIHLLGFLHQLDYKSSVQHLAFTTMTGQKRRLSNLLLSLKYTSQWKCFIFIKALLYVHRDCYRVFVTFMLNCHHDQDGNTKHYQYSIKTKMLKLLELQMSSRSQLFLLTPDSLITV